MATPVIVHSAFARGNSGSITVTLPTTPTVGNLLVFIIAGWSGTLTPPSGLTVLETDSGVSATNQGTWVYQRVVQSGDGTAWAFSGATDYHDIAVFEISGVVSTNIGHGACGGSGTTSITIPSLGAALDPNALRFIVMEWNEGSPVATNPSGWTLLSPGSGSWQNTSGGTYHGAAIWSVPASLSGTQTITMSIAPTTPVWVDVQILTTPTAVKVARGFIEAVTQGTPSVNVARAQLEAITQGVPGVNIARTWIEAVTIGTGELRNTGMIRESLYAAATVYTLNTGMVRETLRSTGTGGATWIGLDGMVRETLRSGAGTPYPVSLPGSYIQAMILA